MQSLQEGAFISPVKGGLYNNSFLMGSCNFPSQISIQVPFKQIHLPCALNPWLTLKWKWKPSQITFYSPISCCRHFYTGTLGKKQSTLKERMRKSPKNNTQSGQKVCIADKQVLPAWLADQEWQQVGLTACTYKKSNPQVY